MARALRSSVVGAAVDAYDRHVGRYGPELARENLDAAIAAWNNSDLDGYLALYDDAITVHGL